MLLSQLALSIISLMIRIKEFIRKSGESNLQIRISMHSMSSMIWDKVYRRDFLQDNDIRLGSYPAAVDVLSS